MTLPELFAAQVARTPDACGGVRGRAAELRRPRCALEPAGASPARAPGSVPRWWWGCDFAVDQAGPNLEVVHGFENQREALRPVVAAPGDQPDADGISPRHKVLNLMDPVCAG